MVKRLALVALLIAAPVAWAQTAYQRPTANSDPGATYNVGCNGGVNVASSDMSNVYSGKSGAGPTGTSVGIPVVYSSGQTYEKRVFTSFQALTGTPSALTLSASVKYISTPTGYAYCVYYSTNSGSSWTTMGTVTSSQTTLTVTITGAVISGVYVLVNPQSGTVSDTTGLIVYDIWTTETYYSATAPPLPGMIRSGFHKHRHKNRPILLARGQ
jgi:hypothetical protein